MPFWSPRKMQILIYLTSYIGMDVTKFREGGSESKLFISSGNFSYDLISMSKKGL